MYIIYGTLLLYKSQIQAVGHERKKNMSSKTRTVFILIQDAIVLVYEDYLCYADDLCLQTSAPTGNFVKVIILDSKHDI